MIFTAIEQIPLFRYGVILADPAWLFANYSEKGEVKNPVAHYDCLPTDEMAKWPVADVAKPDSVMVMWGCWPMAPDAFRLLAAWGFTYKTGGAWAKQSSTGQRLAFGPGYIYRAASEFWIVGTIGQPRVKSRSIRNLILAPVREHSRKPDQMHGDIEALWDGPYLELFARQPRVGWDAFGNDAEKFEAVA